jgi:predicted PurR-regulated permease PerM
MAAGGSYLTDVHDKAPNRRLTPLVELLLWRRHAIAAVHVRPGAPAWPPRSPLTQSPPTIALCSTPRTTSDSAVIRRPSSSRSRLEQGWWRLIIVAALGFFLALVLERLLWEIALPLSLLFVAVVIAQGLAPLVTFLSRWLPRPAAVVGLYLGFLALVAIGTWFFVPSLIAQTQQFAVDLPGLQTSLRAQVDRWSPVDLEQVIAAARTYADRFAALLVALPVSVFSTAANLVLVYFISLYWLLAQPTLRQWFLGLWPEEQRADVLEVLTDIGGTMGGYVRGVGISALLVAIFTYVGLRLIGLPSPLVLAALAGICELIPILGPTLATVPALAVALATGAASPLVVLAFYVGLQQVESNIFVPLIMRGQAQIPPLLSLVAFLLGGAVGGITGALVAIPLFGALRVITERVLLPAQRPIDGESRADAARRGG